MGTVQVSGNGQLIVTNLIVDPAQIVLSGLGGTGILNLSGGTTVADQLIATNGANSIINFGSGELFINYLTEVSNGLSFVVGDGTNAATLVLLGGTHYFNNGLNISKNSTLAGTAVIVAEPVTVAAGGILSPGVQVGTLTISNDLAVSGGILDYSLGTNSDLAVVTGNLTLGGTLNITDAGGFGTGVYTLVAYPVGSNFVYNGVTIGSTPNPSLFYTVDTSIPGLVNLDVTATSPSTSFASWQLQYFGSTNCAKCGGNADFDGNGMSNTNKFLAGFNPTNSAAYLHVISVVKTNSNHDMQITYLGASGDSTRSPAILSRTNVLEFTTGSVNGSYSSNSFTSTGQTNILSGGAGLGTVASMVDSGGATNKPSRFYRVRVLVP